mmetsp:Transcript_6928/g.12969  ORF Transcript_6928/g.12969 Transcript_6928/m.12969 type:complete len:114 (+) Transcript_6928:1969-2310(+)
MRMRSSWSDDAGLSKLMIHQVHPANQIYKPYPKTLMGWIRLSCLVHADDQKSFHASMQFTKSALNIMPSMRHIEQRRDYVQLRTPSERKRTVYSLLYLRATQPDAKRLLHPYD